MEMLSSLPKEPKMNLLQIIENEHRLKLSEGKIIPEFRAGDSVRVYVKVVEGERERVQPYEGVVLGRKNRGINSSFRVRKLSYGEGVERVFPLYSPNIRIEVIRHGDVCRAKLYYLRGRTGKSARIAERRRDVRKVVPKATVATPTAAPSAPAAE